VVETEIFGLSTLPYFASRFISEEIYNNLSDFIRKFFASRKEKERRKVRRGICIQKRVEHSY
jgi:hypothetical protein